MPTSGHLTRGAILQTVGVGSFFVMAPVIAISVSAIFADPAQVLEVLAKGVSFGLVVLAYAVLVLLLSLPFLAVEFFEINRRGSGYVRVQGRVLTSANSKFIIGPECQAVRAGHTLTISDKQNQIVLVGRSVALEQLRSLVQKIIAEQVEAEVPDALHHLTQKIEAR